MLSSLRAESDNDQRVGSEKLRLAFVLSEKEENYNEKI